MARDIDQGPSGQESMVASSEPAGLGLIVGAQRSGETVLLAGLPFYGAWREGFEGRKIIWEHQAQQSCCEPELGKMVGEPSFWASGTAQGISLLGTKSTHKKSL